MRFRIKENDIIAIVEQFLRSQKLVKTLRCLEKESNIIIGSLDEDAAFLRDLIMDGEWDNVLEYLNPFKGDTGYKNVKLAVEKQRYLELLATEQNSYDPGLVMKSLTLLEDLCPTRHEYTGLCYLLTRPRLSQHPAYANWTHYESRLECFQLIHNQFFNNNSKNGDGSVATNRLFDLLTKGLFYESSLLLIQQKLSPGGCVDPGDALTDSLLQCPVEDRDAILLHWLQAIPTEAFVKPLPKKLVQVEMETGVDKTTPNPLIQSTDFLKNRSPSRAASSLYMSIDRTCSSPLKTATLPTTLLQNGSSHLVHETPVVMEETLGDSEVHMDQITAEDITLIQQSPTVVTSTPLIAPTKSPAAVVTHQSPTITTQSPHVTPITQPDATEPAVIEDASFVSPPDLPPKTNKVNDPFRGSSSELLVPSLLEIEMGFKSVELVETEDKGTEASGKDEAGGQPELILSTHSVPQIGSYTKQQEEKIRSLQLQLNEIRNQQDSLRRSTALEKAGKVPTHRQLGEPRTPSKPLYVHPNDMNVSADRLHSDANDRGTVTDAPTAPTMVPQANGWLEPVSNHTLESFSEDSLRPSKTSTPNKLRSGSAQQVADSSMLRVRFAPTAVLEDVQPIRCAAFHPGGELIAIGSNSRALRVCSSHMLSDSVQTLLREDGCQDLPVLFKRNRHHKGSVYALSWNPSGNLIATGSNDKSLIVVGFDSDNCITVGTDREFSFHKGTIRDIHFSCDRTMLSGGGGDNLLHVSDVSKGVEVSAYSGHTGAIHCITSHKGDTLLTGSEDATIRMWDRRSNTCSRVIGAAIGTQGNSAVTSLSLNHYGNLLCAAREDGLCLLYDIDMGKLLAAFSPHSTATCKSVQFYKNPRYILSGSYDGTIALTCAEQVLLSPEVPATEILGTHRDKVTNVTWHPKKQAFATCSADRTVCLWSAKDGVDD